MSVDIHVFVEVIKNGEWRLSDKDVCPSLRGDFFTILRWLGDVGVPDELLGVTLPDGTELTEIGAKECGLFGFRTLAPGRMRDEYARAMRNEPFFPHAAELLDWDRLQNRPPCMLGTSEALEEWQHDTYVLDGGYALELMRMADALDADERLFYFFDI